MATTPLATSHPLSNLPQSKHTLAGDRKTRSPRSPRNLSAFGSASTGTEPDSVLAYLSAGCSTRSRPMGEKPAQRAALTTRAE